MAGKKTVEAVEKKAEAVKEEVKEVAEKAAAKTKSTAKKAASTAKKAAAGAKAKAGAKKADTEPVVVVQLTGKEFNIKDIVEAAKADYKSKGHNTPKNLAVYVKPEEGVAYYTVNGKGSDEQKVNF